MSSNSFSLRSSETIPLTRALAIAHRDMPASPTERSFSESRAKKLRTSFEEGLILPCSWAKAIWKNEEVRMNGQHSSNVLADLEPFPEGSYVHMDIYEPDNGEGMARLFRQFDARVSSRSATDCSHAYQGLHDSIADIEEVKALAAIKGINWFNGNVDGGERFAGDEMGKMFSNRSYDKFICFISELLSGKCKELRRDEIIAAMWGTFLMSESLAAEFWNDVKSAHKDGEPSQVLDEQLERDSEKRDPTSRMKPKPRYAVCVKAWNAFLGQETPPSVGWKHSKDKALPEIHSAV